MQKITILLIWLILINSGCTNQSTLVSTQKLKDKHSVIVHIKTKNEIITVLSGQTGPVYNVTTKNGKILGQYLSAKELRENLPEIYRLMKASYADDPENVVIWADCDHRQ
ncbi:MAG: hypothetical protein JW837_04705 [Sedimentisphaerales bacterium]|nr:hypothetical protein [Sedimentisphaerales bacterium]